MVFSTPQAREVMTSQSSDRSHPNVTLAVLGLGAVAYAVLSSAVVPALPTMQHDLHTSETWITWLRPCPARSCR
jgi:predicted MFS family arabinose efflux permease